MNRQNNFTADELTELIGEDMSLPGFLAALINDGGDIRAFLVKKLSEQRDAMNESDLIEALQWMDARQFIRAMGLRY